jgi:phenylpropionate dioxygenase-like ring-hydroxylating dioxygenase large terminal subunit
MTDLDEAPRTARSIANDHPVLRRQWHPVALADEITDSPTRVVVCEQQLVLARLADGVAVLPDTCPHRNAPLSAGQVVDGHLECPHHGWRFGADGGCRFIPALGPDATLPPKAHLAAPLVRQAYGLVFVCLEPGADEPAPPMLAVPEWGAPGIVPVWLPVVTVRGGGAQLLDNFLDFTHFPFIHAGTFGAGEDSFVGDYDVDHDDVSLKVRYEHVVENKEDPGVASGERPLLQPRTMEYTFTVPFAGRLRLELPLTGVENTILFWASPVDADHSRVFCALLRNDVSGPDDAEAVAARDYEFGVLTEDVWMLEQLPTTSLPLDLPAQAHTRADRITVEMRRLLAAMVA